MAEDHEQSPPFTVKRKVDESWKETIEREKKSSSHSESSDQPNPLSEPNFSMFVSTIGMQVLMALGETEDPANPAKKADLGQAQYLIDILEMLSAKTKGNLSAEEQAMMQTLLYQLRLKFVEKSKTP